jgi:UDP-glucose 4-epimerase
LAVEKYLNYYNREYGLNYVALRYANFSGPRQNPHGEAGVVAIFAQKQLRREQAIIKGDGTQRRDFVYVQDVARANLLALKNDFCGSLNIGTALEMEINQLFRLLKKQTASSSTEYHGPPKPGEQKRSVIDYSKARQVLGWEILTPLEKGLELTVNYFRQR